MFPVIFQEENSHAIEEESSHNNDNTEGFKNKVSQVDINVLS